MTLLAQCVANLSETSCEELGGDVLFSEEELRSVLCEALSLLQFHDNARLLHIEKITIEDIESLYSESSYLVRDLKHSAAVLGSWTLGTPQSDILETFERLVGSIDALLDGIRQASIRALLAAFQCLRDEIRTAYRLLAFCRELDSWQSPAHIVSTGGREVGFLQVHDVVPYVHDYQRWSLGPRVASWEEIYAEKMFDVEGTRHVALSYLCSSCMTSIQLAFVVCHELLGGIDRIVILDGSYFEIEEVARKHAPCSLTSLNDVVDKCQPERTVLVLEPIQNSMARSAVDIPFLLTKLQAANRDPILVIDRSLLGCIYQEWKPLLRKRPNCVILVVESLLKSAQYGLDLAQGGVFTCLVQADNVTTLRDMVFTKRAIHGYLPVDTHFSSYPSVYADILKERLFRHERNARVLASMLFDLAAEITVVHVSYPDIPSENCNGAGSLISVSNTNERDACYYEELVQKLSSDFSRSGVTVNVGLGFGFQHTRLCVALEGFASYEKQYYIRIAAGAEDLSSMLLICGVLYKRLRIELNSRHNYPP